MGREKLEEGKIEEGVEPDFGSRFGRDRSH